MDQSYCTFSESGFFRKTAIPWSTTPQRSRSPCPPNSMLSFWILCLAGLQKSSHLCWWCSALPITTLKLGVAGVSKLSLWFQVDGCFCLKPGSNPQNGWIDKYRYIRLWEFHYMIFHYGFIFPLSWGLGVVYIYIYICIFKYVYRSREYNGITIGLFAVEILQAFLRPWRLCWPPAAGDSGQPMDHGRFHHQMVI